MIKYINGSMKKWINKEDWDFMQEYRGISNKKINNMKQDLNMLTTTTNGYSYIEPEVVKAKSNIGYIPSFKGIVITEYIRPEILVKSKKASKIISVNEVKDSELLELGLNTKGAMIANKGSEDQDSFIIVAIGIDVDQRQFNIGDRVLLRSAAQPIGLEVGGKLYGQVHEYEVAGKLVN